MKKTHCPVIVLDSTDDSDEDISEVPPVEVTKTTEITKHPKAVSKSEECVLIQKDVKRIKPILISTEVAKATKNEDFEADGFEDSANGHNDNNSNGVKDDVQQPSSTTNTIENPITESFAKLIAACRQADSSNDMEQLINKKLLKYYRMVHPDFVHSKSFGKTVASVTDEILANPRFVYLKLSNILEELNIRRKSGQTVVTNEGVASTGNERKDYQIKRLNKALYILKKKIAQLELTEVDLDDEINSLYLLTERYKKRACEIYEKICDITGESKHAHRQVKKPIIFKGTKYPQFNKTIQTFVNQTGAFPDLFDVLRILEHCNQQYNLKLGKEEIKMISQDAFTRIGKSLQKRRKTDLYETVSFYSGGTEKDPASDDPTLKAKLEENRKHHSRINELINKYAEIQEKSSDIKNTASPSLLADVSVDGNDQNQNNKENHVKNNSTTMQVDEDDSSEDDELEAEEDEAICNPNIEIIISESEDEELS